MFELFLRIILVKISKLCGYMVVIFEKKELISKISTKRKPQISTTRKLRSRKFQYSARFARENYYYLARFACENTTICARFAGAQKTTMSEASLITPGFGTVERSRVAVAANPLEQSG